VGEGGLRKRLEPAMATLDKHHFKQFAVET
jgi:hypothetical protein